MGIKNLKLIDYIVIIIQFGYHLSILSSFIMMPYHIGITAFMALAYVIRFKRIADPFEFVLKSKLFVIFFIICLFDILQFIVTDFGLGIGRAIITINFLLFVLYLDDIYKRLPDNEKTAILAPYTVYGVYNVVTIILAAALIFFGVLSATSNPIALSIMQDNIANESDYYFPGYLSVVIDINRVLANIPVLTGLSHEPHVLCFLVMPVAFLALGRIKSFVGRFIIYCAVVVLLIVSMSTTAITVFGIVILTEFIWSLGRTQKTSNILLMVIVIALAATYFVDVLSETQLFMINKFDTNTGSLDYSENLLKYVVTPTGFLGTGNKGSGDFFVGADTQIGFVTSFLDILFYIILCFKIVKLVLSKDNNTHYIGLACLYFALHLLKVSFLVFNYPYLVYVMFIIERFSQKTKNSPSLLQQNFNYLS